MPSAPFSEVDVPMTLAGLSRFNIENALAAASAALALASVAWLAVHGSIGAPKGIV